MRPPRPRLRQVRTDRGALRRHGHGVPQRRGGGRQFHHGPDDAGAAGPGTRVTVTATGREAFDVLDALGTLVGDRFGEEE